MQIVKWTSRGLHCGKFGHLIGVEPDPSKIEFGMPVEVVYKDALGRKDKEGNSYLSYFFQPHGKT